MRIKFRSAYRAAYRAASRTALSIPVRWLPAYAIIAVIAALLLPSAITSAANAVTLLIGRITTGQPAYSGHIAPLFTPQVQYWSADIERWARERDLDPNLLATVMQIESCGHDKIGSSAGAQGLFQVMPFHFSTGEIYTDPETNARRGANFLAECLNYWSGGDPNLAMACYNGGPSVVSRPFHTWAHETRRYYVWGGTIYADAVQNKSDSPALDTWLNAGGIGLCQRAADNLGIALGIP